MKYATLKYRMPLLIIGLWVFPSRADALSGMGAAGNFILMVFIWLVGSIAGIELFKSLKEKTGEIAYKLLHYLFLLIFAALFFTVYGMYLEGESADGSFLEMITSTKNLKAKLILLSIGFIALFRMGYIIRKDYKKTRGL